MAFPGGCPIQRRRRLVAGIVFLFVLAGAAAQEQAAVDLFSPTAVVGKKIPFRIRTNIPWTYNVAIENPELESPLRWWALPYPRSWSSPGPDGVLQRKVEILGTLQADKPGFHPVGSFRISARDLYTETLPLVVVALEEDEKDLPYPVRASYRAPPQELWEGEAFPLVLSVKDLASLAIADDIILEAPAPGLLEVVKDYGTIETRSFQENLLYDVPVRTWIWTPDEPGTNRFPGARVSVMGLNRKIPGFSVEVRPLPEEALASGAVGDFQLKVMVPQDSLRAGSPVPIRVRAEGTGNLNVLRLPVPEIPGASLISESQESSYHPHEEGYQGWREGRYDFQIETPGSAVVTIPAWSWLDKGEGGEIRREAPREFFLDIDPPEKKTTLPRTPVFLGVEALNTQKTRFTWRNPLGFLFLLPGFLAALLVFLIKKKKQIPLLALIILLFSGSAKISPEEYLLLTAAAEAQSAGRGAEALAVYQQLWDKYPETPGILHDTAVLINQEGRVDQAVYALRRALHLKPGDRKIRQTLEIIESQHNLADQVLPPLRRPPWIVFALWLCAGNFLFVSLAAYFLKKGAREIILTILALLLLAVASGGILVIESRWHSVTAVVVENAVPLTKIPGSLATDFLSLPPGTAVRVRAVTPGGCLVQSEYGLEGWLPRDSMLFVTEKNYEFWKNP